MGVYTLTPNPTLDLGGFVESIVPDEKNYVHEETRHPGGNGINAARIISRLGLSPTVLGFIGGGVGRDLEHLLAAEKLKTDFVDIGGHTRINVTVSNRATRHQTRLSFAGPRISLNEKRALWRKLSRIPRGSYLVLGGSFPAGLSPAELRPQLRWLQSRGVFVVIDTPGPILKSLLSCRPLLIKPNLSEFCELIGRNVKSIKDILPRARQLTKKVPFVCISSVAGGALLVTRDGAWFGKIAPVKIRSTVGAGDSMVGAMTAQLFRRAVHTTPNFEEELLRWALAAAGATLSRPGTALGGAREIQRLLSKTRVRAL